jgi:hypothetical protein
LPLSATGCDNERQAINASKKVVKNCLFIGLQFAEFKGIGQFGQMLFSAKATGLAPAA